MKKIFTGALILCSFAVVGQIGSKAQQQSGIHGTWTNNQFGYQMTLKLNTDGSGEFDGEPMKYTVAGSKLTLNLSGVSTPYNYVLQDNALTLSGGDIDGSIVFARQGVGPVTTPAQPASANLPTVQQGGAGGKTAGIVGVWSGNGETIEFKNNGECLYAGQTLGYELSGNALILKTAQGNATMNYVLTGNQLTLSANGQSFTYSKSGTEKAAPTSSLPSAQQKNTETSTGTGSTDIVGVWTRSNEIIEFNKNGQCLYGGQTFTYKVSGSSITIQSAQGSASMGYVLSGNELMLSINGQTSVYSRGGAGATGQAQPASANRRIAPELVGKWCWINVTSTNSGGRTSERCITFNGDGTYQYAAESSMSVNTNAFYGGTNSQSSDRGTWTYDGVRVYYNSQMGRGAGSYVLEKRNHPKNNDPMIVLDGETYVTQYQKPRWQ
ncbi:MAG: hypothetical protein KF687_03635 [Cyclobacteriaceae bacterium]|nr:hypothetical protein [Cyclobacteriaceae bacterium]